MKKYSIKPTVLINRTCLINRTLLAAAVGLALNSGGVWAVPVLVHCPTPISGVYNCAPAGPVLGGEVAIVGIDETIERVNMIASSTDNATVSVISDGVANIGIVNQGISVIADTGNATVTVAAGSAVNGDGISASSSGGIITIQNDGGTVANTNGGSSAILATSSAGSNIIIQNSGAVTNTTGSAITANFGSGEALITNSGSGNLIGGIALSGGAAGSATVNNSSTISGDISLTGGVGDLTVNNSGGITGGISSATSGTTSITNNASHNITGGINSTGSGTTSVTNAGTISGVISSAGSDAMTIINSGSIIDGIGSTSSSATLITNNAGGNITGVINSTGSGATSITNSGNITGRINLTGAASHVVSNNNTWVISDGGAATVANQFGASGNFTNGGTISVDSGVNNVTLTGLNQFTNTGIINFSNTTMSSVTSGSFTNSGTINLSDGITVGNNFTITGNYVANGGSLHLDTVLDGDSSTTDLLTISGNASRGTGATIIHINNVGGLGELTGAGPTDGIKIISVTGTNDSTAFALANGHVRAGAYSYYLFGEDGSGESWYLRSRLSNPFTGEDRIAYSPELGAYLSNRDSVISLFSHSLHERIGEPRYTQSRAGQGDVPSVWLRVAGNQVNRDMREYALDVRTNTYLTQLGGEIASWQKEGNRLHLGLMGGMGNSSSKVHADYDINNEAKGEVRGYSVGAYATWYGNQGQQTGAYVDGWVQYGWYRNKVNSNVMTQQRYNSNLWTASVESGYATLAHEYDQTHVMLEPQAQVTYHYYSAKDQIDSQNLRISNSNTQGIETRLGMRAYLRDKQLVNPIQPFIETNWFYRNTSKDMRFDDVQRSGEIPKNRFEIKVGLQSEASKDVQFYAHLGQQFGKDDYRRTEGAVGVKVLF